METIALFLGYLVVYFAAAVALLFLAALGMQFVWRIVVRILGLKLLTEACSAYRKTHPEKFKTYDKLYNEHR